LDNFIVTEPRRVFKKSEARRRPKRSSGRRKFLPPQFLEENSVDEVTKVPFALTTLGSRASTDEGQGFSESKERNVEVMVVADRSMMDFHDKESATDLETYLLTVMNMVWAQFRFKTDTIRSNMNYV